MWTCMRTAPSYSPSPIISRLSFAAGKVMCIGLKDYQKRYYLIGILLSYWKLTELWYIPDCDAFFKIKYRLREHLRSHTQERLVACPTCGCMFSSNTKFFDHIQRQAEPEGL